MVSIYNPNCEEIAMFFNWLKRKTNRKQAAAGLYQSTRSQSRDPVFYADWNVADTMDGRFDVLSLHVALLLGRLGQLGAEGQKLGQAVFDCMFHDIDETLRETGVGDLGVPKHMAKMMKAFNGRVHAYNEALETRDIKALSTAIARNLYRFENIPAQGQDIVSYVVALHDVLATQTLDTLMHGKIVFPQPPAMFEQQRFANA